VLLILLFTHAALPLLNQINVLIATFVPSQGFFNFLVFIRPRYCAVRRNFPACSRWWALSEAVWNPFSKARGRDVATARRDICPLKEEEPLDDGDNSRTSLNRDAAEGAASHPLNSQLESRRMDPADDNTVSGNQKTEVCVLRSDEAPNVAVTAPGGESNSCEAHAARP
jgi:hypothetical protein